jgi:ATP-binding cassette subfamily B protein
VGENGSGKTTLVKLLCRLYELDGGRILWGREDARDWEPAELRAGMTILFQDFLRYHLTVADNIVLGRSDMPPSAARVEAAARQAGAHEAITALPSGYDTRLGREFLGGHELSGGQWQRLALARAFYRDADFLIMDEPTASLDPRAEYRLFEQMRALAAGKSVLLISHRFANVRMADRIYVLHQGRIVESGDHRQLLSRDGLYADLFRLQASAYGMTV